MRVGQKEGVLVQSRVKRLRAVPLLMLYWIGVMLFEDVGVITAEAHESMTLTEKVLIT